MVEFEIPSPSARRRLQAAFAARSGAGDLLQHAPGAAAGIAASRLYRHATARGGDDPELTQALRENLMLRRAYVRLERSLARLRMPALRAASSGDFPARRIPGCRLRVERSAADSAQYYLVIEFEDGLDDASRPDTMVLVDRDEQCHRFALPAARRGVIQHLIDGASAMLPLLRDPQTEVMLR